MIIVRLPRTLAALRIFMVVAGAAATAGWAPASAKDAAGPFGRFAGAWTGGGQVVGARGDRERIRCRANYAESGHGEAVTQTIVCASASYRMNIQSHVEASGGMIHGSGAKRPATSPAPSRAASRTAGSRARSTDRTSPRKSP